MDLYTPLDHTENEIRLLRVDLSGAGQHELVSKVALRSKRQRYQALSYTWGDQNDRTSISVSGKSFSISQSLKEALDGVHAFWRKIYSEGGKPLLLWCDQICIDQASGEEKNRQVAYMSEIYRRAEQVVIWLPVRASVTSGFDNWAEWRDFHETQVKARAQDLQTAYTSPQPMAYLPRQLSSQSLITAWKNVRTIAESPWWSRAWVYQEFILATRATFLIAGLVAPWTELQEVLASFTSHEHLHSDAVKAAVADAERKANQIESIQETQVRKERSYVEKAIELPEGCEVVAWAITLCPGSSQKEEEQARRRDDLTNQAEEVKNNATEMRRLASESLGPHGASLSSISRSWNTAQSLMASKGAIQEGTFAPLSQLMRHARNCQCQDPRDKIFAFLGLTGPSYNIVVDYDPRNTLHDVVTRATAAVIMTEESLNILDDAKEDGEIAQAYDHLPSWVPNFTTPDRVNVEYQKFVEGIQLPSSGLSATKHSRATVSFHADRYGNPERVLRARGIRLGRLSRIVHDPAHEPWRLFEDEYGRRIGTRSDARPGDEVWVLFGADVPFTLTKPSDQDKGYQILGQAMIWEDEKPSPIMYGYYMDLLANKEVYDEEVFLI